jgi:hypothetical protein
MFSCVAVCPRVVARFLRGELEGQTSLFKQVLAPGSSMDCSSVSFIAQTFRWGWEMVRVYS